MNRLAIAVLLLSACHPPRDGTSRTAPPSADGVVAFETVRRVLQHPRCQNCHPAGDAPLQGDDSHVHTQNVQRGPEGRGMVGAECTTCHGLANPPNAYGPHVPPGNANGWHMPPPDTKLVFVGLSPRALCEQVRDPARNGRKDRAALRAHLEDPLVVWGWAPGRGRTPVSTPRDTFLAAWETWARAGAPCPD
ncbi:hypothetical protein LVJ94_33560 [Pendulispora rubella]|uniref:Isoquinoline 1-oxidoreductase subunit n=1 Tax=Pendulispora rubella TaxID=2741070 RepID=A0ABZ2KT53_9BACT